VLLKVPKACAWPSSVRVNAFLLSPWIGLPCESVTTTSTTTRLLYSRMVLISEEACWAGCRTPALQLAWPKQRSRNRSVRVAAAQRTRIQGQLR